MASLAALAAALALAAPELDGRVSVGALERTRVTSVGFEELTTHSVEATPAASFELRGIQADAGGAYTPLLRVPDVTGDTRLDVLHRADLRLVSRLAPTWTATFKVEGEKGRTDLRTTGSRDAEGRAVAVPTLAPVDVARAAAEARLAARLDPRTTLDAFVRGTAGGGDGPAASAVLNVQHTVAGGGRLTWHATRLDVLAAILEAGAGRNVQTLALYRHLTLAGALEHRLSRTLAARAGGGVALVSSVQGPLQRVSAWEPVAYGALSHVLERPARIATDLELRYAPYLDVVSGGANQRLEGIATAAWTLSPSWRLAWRGVGARTFTGDTQLFTGNADLGLEWATTPQLRLTAGISSEWQRATAGRGFPAFTEYGVFLAASFDLQRPRAERDGRDGGPGGVEGEGAGPGGQAGPGGPAGPGAREAQGRGDEGTRR